MTTEAIFEGKAFAGRDTECGEVEDSGEDLFIEDFAVVVVVVLVMKRLGWVGDFVERRSVRECGGGGECVGDDGKRVKKRRFVENVRMEEEFGGKRKKIKLGV
jgi:hypothetical protein